MAITRFTSRSKEWVASDDNKGSIDKLGLIYFIKLLIIRGEKNIVDSFT